jgi:hypothetical protein
MALDEETLSQTSFKGSVRYGWIVEKEFEDCEEQEDFFRLFSMDILSTEWKFRDAIVKIKWSAH